MEGRICPECESNEYEIWTTNGKELDKCLKCGHYYTPDEVCKKN